MNTAAPRGHVAIVGPTQSGKSTLARAMAREYMRRGIPVLVCDPNGEKWPVARPVFNNSAAFIEYAKQCRRCALFIDEASATVGRGKSAEACEWLVTRARHWGHVSHLMLHTVVSVEPKIRLNIPRWFMFRPTEDGCRIIEREQGARGLVSMAGAVSQFQFLQVEPSQDGRICKLDI
jgi:energy-coupling factor transporter ATP-binding protein EcfA2